MYRARERGMSFWPFAVSLLLLIALVFMWFGASSERDQWKARADKATADAARAEQEKVEEIRKFQEASRHVGFLEGGNTSSSEALSRTIKEWGEKYKPLFTVEFPSTVFQADAAGGQVVKQEGGKVTVAYLTDAEIGDATTLQSFFGKVEVAATRMKADMARGYAMSDQAIKDKESAAKASDDTIKTKDQRIAELMGEKAAVENAAREKEAELKEAITQKEQSFAAKEKEADDIRKQASENENKLAAALAAKKQELNAIVQRDAPVLTEGPDGEVVVSDRGVAIVNRGRTNWLMPGTIFEVLGRAKGGATYHKGTIKVTSVDEETARAAILDETARDPITRGDLIQSLTYSPTRQLHFVLIGDFKKMGRSTAEALLKKLGAVVDSKVTSETNFLVVGSPAAGQAADALDDTEAVKTAKELGIRMITEEQLGSFPRY
jgi:hypothetical protein